MVRLTDRPDMSIAVYCGRKITKPQQQQTATLIQQANKAHFLCSIIKSSDCLSLVNV